MNILKKIISFLVNLFKNEKRKTDTDIRPTESRTIQQRDSDTTGDAVTDTGILDSEAERGRVQRAEPEQSRQTENETEGGRGEPWDISKIWNHNFIAKQETKPDQRDWLRGSDLGKPMSDVFLKMKGVEYSNPPNDRSLRKFESGNVHEYFFKLLLMRAGIYKSTQEEVSFQYPGLLRISGHPDFIAGGRPNWEEAKANLKNLPLPPVFSRTYAKVIEYLEQKYPQGLEELVLEIKSTSGDFFNVLEKSGKALKMHRLQLYNYLKSLNKPRGSVIYISRDDMRILSIPVLNPHPKTEEEYYNYIKQMTEYYQRDEMPPIEQPIVFDEDMQRIKKNSMIGWSSYLTRLYGFKDQKAFDDIYTPLQSAFTRVITRIKEEKPLTKSNLEYIEKMKSFGFDPYEIAKISK